MALAERLDKHFEAFNEIDTWYSRLVGGKQKKYQDFVGRQLEVSEFARNSCASSLAWTLLHVVVNRLDASISCWAWRKGGMLGTLQVKQTVQAHI